MKNCSKINKNHAKEAQKNDLFTILYWCWTKMTF